jgi:hypothetical protein
MNISFETNTLVDRIVSSVRAIEEKKATLGDETTFIIKQVTQKLRDNKVPLVEVVFSYYVEELGYDIDFWVKWDGNIFLTSSETNDDYKPILGQKIEHRVSFVKGMPEILKDMKKYFDDKLAEITFDLEEEEEFDEDDLIPEEMSEEEKDAMMMNGIED